MHDLVIIGGGAAGLMAAETALNAGLKVVLCEGKPSLGRKILMAGKSGLNLSKDEHIEDFIEQYENLSPTMDAAIRAFGPSEVYDWAHGLDQELFVGSSGRLYPTAMKASPLMRAWISRLTANGLDLRVNWKWTNGTSDVFHFETRDGTEVINARAVIFALGGGSWSRLGADGAWVDKIEADISPLRPANMGFNCDWSDKMASHFGGWLKNVELHCDGDVYKGEMTISKYGLQGGVIYAASSKMRKGAPAYVDLLPLRTEHSLTGAYANRGKMTVGNFYRKMGLSDTAKALFFESRRSDNPLEVKRLKLPVIDPRPIDEAISTSGGVIQSALDKSLMSKTHKGTFFAGEMLDWSAPTGGYLLTACLASGRAAALGAVEYLRELM